MFRVSSARSVDYWTDSRRPLASLLFLLPLLGLYEFGALHLAGAQIAAVRNGADVWMRNWLLQAGLDRPWLLPVFIVVALLAWHVVQRFPWKLSLDTIVGMAAESLLGAVLLLVVGQVLSLMLRQSGWASPELVEASISPQAARAVGFLGAGIYEEVLFRLLLLPSIYLLLRTLLLSKKTAAVVAILTTSFVFALAHYLEPGSETFAFHPQAFAAAAESVINSPQAWFGFSFRLIAGIVFAALFMIRGFGITVGCHVVYDLLVGVVMATPET